MRKILLITVAFFATLLTASAQKGDVDSLRKAYQKNKQDSTLALLLVERSSSDYLTTNTDSGMICARQALDISNRIGFKKGAVRAKAAMAVFLQINGDLPGSLKVTFEALPEAIQIQEWRVVASCYNTRGLTYSTLKNLKKSLDNYYAAMHIVEQYHFDDLYLVELNNIARQYLDMNRLDSAAWFNQKAYDLAIKKTLKKNLGYMIRNFGIIRFKKGDMPGAIAFYRKSLADPSAHGNHYLQSEDFRRIAEAYQKLNQTDSCVNYAKKALEQARLDKNPDLVQRTAGLLTEEYKLKGDFKNAFFFQQETLQASDSLFSQQKTLQVQNLAYNEQQKQQAVHDAEIAYQNKVRFYILLGIIAVFVLIAAILVFANTQRKKANTLLRRQNDQIETQRRDLEKTVADLKTTQKQLIQSEKMASLGELTAGIAHEIQNPLNFVNNFSEVNTELIEEMEMEISQSHLDEVRAIAESIRLNQQKISQHGKRADFIVKGMLQHSRNSTGEKQETNLNVLADEFFKLSFHGLRAKDKSFNAEMVTHFDDKLPKINVAQQDIGRVLLNLFNNAFYAVNKKAKTAGPDYKPMVELSTSTQNGLLYIKVKDNGTGIPDSVKDKIMQPFFTTKPTGEGTGLGLSLSYDIVTKGHGGKIEVNSTEGESAEFIITLPLS
jgi:two-component system NtrC family sensor kinase